MAKKKRFRSYYFLWISYYFCYTWISYYFLWSYERSLTFFKKMSIQKNQQTQLKQTFQKNDHRPHPQKIPIIILPRLACFRMSQVDLWFGGQSGGRHQGIGGSSPDRFFFRWGEMRCWKTLPVVRFTERWGFFIGKQRGVGGFGITETSLESKVYKVNWRIFFST